LSPEELPDLAAGSLFAGFRIEAVVGSGGMGTVYRALDLALDHERALKVLTSDLTADSAFRERFQRESRLAAQLEDDGVVPIYGAGEAEGRLYIAMRLVRGSDLHKAVAEDGPLSLARTAMVTAAVARALDAAHARGIVHRDVKPANILVERSGGGERVFLTDFGISRPVTATTSITSTGQLLGTPDYISPEQIDGARPGPAADIYALGCVVCFLLTGEAPFHRETAVATLYAHTHAERPRPSLLTPELPDGVDEVLARATAVDPADRFSSAGELAAALMHTVDPSERPAGAAAAPITPRTRELPRPKRSRRRWLAAGVVAGLAAVAVAAVLLLGGSEDPARAPANNNVTSVPVGDAADSVVVGEVNVLVGSHSDSTLHTIDPATGTLGASPKTVPHPTSVAVGFGSVWVTSGSGDELLRYGPEDRDVATPIGVGDEPVDVAIGDQWVWVVNRAEGTVTQIDPLRNRIEATVDVAPRPQSVVADDDAGVTWVASPSVGKLTRIDSSGAEATADEVSIGGAPTDLAIVEGSLWEADASHGTLAELSLDDGRRLSESTDLGGEPVALAVGPGALWVADKARDLAIRINPSTGEQERVEVDNRPTAIAVGAGAVWVANTGDETVSRIER
jgi:streptogramin lyase/tRNA A-37 threonylcarbamoyl transferase component Bud32